MDRIAIIGCGGSGKTYLANRMAILLNLPRTHLDGIYYDADWNTLSREDFATYNATWSPDHSGSSTATTPAPCRSGWRRRHGDLSRLAPGTCLASVVRRRFRYRGGQHAKEGIYNRLSWKFIRYIWTYRAAMCPRIRVLLNQHSLHAQLITFDQPPAGGPVRLATRSRVRDSDLTPIEVERR